ncbi:hypothetical protein ACROYT_G021115 [Oculina patagonica]
MKIPQQDIFSAGHPSKYLPRATGLNFGYQTQTNAFLVVSVSDETEVRDPIRDPIRDPFRDPIRSCPIRSRHENLVLVKGDAYYVESFAAALDGKDAVLSSLGVYANIFNPTTFYSESMNAITEAMSRHKITRLVTVTSWCTQPGPNNYWFLEWVIKPLFLNGVIKDMATMENIGTLSVQELFFQFMEWLGGKLGD